MKRIARLPLIALVLTLAAPALHAQTQPATTGASASHMRPAANFIAMQHHLADSLLANAGLPDADKAAIRALLKDFDASVENLPSATLSEAQCQTLAEPLGKFLFSRQDLTVLAVIAARNWQAASIMIMRDMARLAAGTPATQQEAMSLMFLGPPEFVPLLKTALDDPKKVEAATAILQKAAPAFMALHDEDAQELAAIEVRKQIRAQLTPAQNAAVDWALARVPSSQVAGLLNLENMPVTFSSFSQSVPAPQDGKYMLQKLQPDTILSLRPAPDAALATVTLKKGQAVGFRPAPGGQGAPKALAAEREIAITLQPGEIAVWLFVGDQ